MKNTTSACVTLLFVIVGVATFFAFLGFPFIFFAPPVSHAFSFSLSLTLSLSHTILGYSRFLDCVFFLIKRCFVRFFLLQLLLFYWCCSDALLFLWICIIECIDIMRSSARDILMYYMHFIYGKDTMLMRWQLWKLFCAGWRCILCCDDV